MGRLNSIHKLLIDNEIDDKYAKDLISRAKGDVPKNCDDKELILKIKALMIDDLKDIGKSETGLRGPIIEFFIGPSGSGRTSALACRAGKLYLDQKKRIGLISADSWRVCGWEQISYISKIFECPHLNLNFYGDKIEQDVKAFIDANTELEAFLVDTVAYYKHEEWITSFGRLYDAFEGYKREIKLVFPTTGKYRDLIGIADYISQRYDYNFIFTKLDETEALGVIYNLRRKTGKPIDYVKNSSCWEGIYFSDFDAEEYIEKMLRWT